MRTTVRIDDELLTDLKELAHQEGVSLASLFNRTLRLGLHALKNGSRPARKPYVEKTFDMGVPRFDVTKAAALAAELEDEEIIKKMARGQ